MYLDDTLTLITAALSGAMMGSLLLLTLIYKPFFKQLKLAQQISIYKRFYRLNLGLCLLAGILAALLKYQQSAFLLAIIGVSYVFANMHLLKAIQFHFSQQNRPESDRLKPFLRLAQNLLHSAQFLATALVIYFLI